MFFIVYLSAILLAGCTSVQTITLSSYAGKISFYENTAEYYPTDNIMKCKLSDTAMLNGYKCISWLWFFKNGQIRQFETAENIKKNSFTIPSNSIIFFNEQSPGKIKYIWFSGDVTINKIACKGGGKISTEFYENDSLKACFLSKDQNIQGYECQSSLLEPVYFYPNGKIKILTLAADSKFGNKEYKRGESILIGEDGMVNQFKR
jgi:hypothetical protein